MKNWNLKIDQLSSLTIASKTKAFSSRTKGVWFNMLKNQYHNPLKDAFLPMIRGESRLNLLKTKITQRTSIV